MVAAESGTIWAREEGAAFVETEWVCTPVLRGKTARCSCIVFRFYIR